MALDPDFVHGQYPTFPALDFEARALFGNAGDPVPAVSSSTA